ncbi:Acidic phospholipase A2 PA4 [Halotydeus destructor]|nr:Acidic phospholipase A2 PA4 [Halotydeus destructor]
MRVSAIVTAILSTVTCFTPRAHFFLPRALWLEPMDYSPEESLQMRHHSTSGDQRLPSMSSNHFNTHNFSSSPSISQTKEDHEASASADDAAVLELVVSNLNLTGFGSDRLMWFSEEEVKLQEATESAHNDLSLAAAKHFKTVTICDKTLAIADYIDDSAGSKQMVRCELFDLEKNPEKAYKEADRSGLPMEVVEFATMRNIITKCRKISEDSTELSLPAMSDDVQSLPSHLNATDGSKSSMLTSWRALLPGTKWCGLGDSASNYFDLGKRKDVDVCCRAHDHCPIRLKALRSGYGLLNLSLYTKSHCDCDEDFMRCLRHVNSKVSEMLGNFYFNIMKVQCIKEEKTLICKEYRKSANGKDECVRFESDKNNTKMIITQPEVQF